MTWVLGLRCRECKAEYDTVPQAICDQCLGPLDVVYDWPALERRVTRTHIEQGPHNIWRYADLLPVDPVDHIGDITGWTPLWHAKRLGEALGHPRIYVKNDAVNAPSLSFKDRVVAMALGYARHHGIQVVGCPSTGNLANAVAAQAARHGFQALIFIPEDLERAKILGSAIYQPRVYTLRGNYDQVNRLCFELAETFGWGIVNVNLRAYYGEGSKTLGYEVMEQLGWALPDHVVVPMAGGSLITKIHHAFQEWTRLGLVEDRPYHLHGAQAEGCAPIVHAWQRGDTEITPERPRTIAKSLSIGNPADGRYALRTIRESHGRGLAVTDDEIREGIRLLAATEGLFTETAGGVVVAAAKQLLAEGHVTPEQTVVLLITGNGLKTLDAVQDLPMPIAGPLEPTLEAFQAYLDRHGDPP